MKFAASDNWWGSEFCERLVLAKKYGFRAIEDNIWTGVDLEKARQTLIETGVKSTALLLRNTDSDKRHLMSAKHGMVYEGNMDVYIESFNQTAAAAKMLDVQNIIMVAGATRDDVSYEQQFENCVITLKTLSKMAEDSGLTIVLEPLNVLVDHKGYFLSKTEDAVRMIKAVDSPNCKILFDIYHQQITEGNVIRNIRNNIEHIGYFHIADNPGRKQPGTGELNYRNIFKAIEETGYDGWLAFECSSTVDTDTLVKEMHELIDPFDK